MQAPDIHGNNRTRNAFICKLDSLIEPHPADTPAVASYINEVKKIVDEYNRENIGVEREVDILLDVLNTLEPEVPKQLKLIEEASQRVPYSTWLKIQIARKLTQDKERLLKRIEDEEKKAKADAKKRGDVEGQQNIDFSAA